MKRIEIKNLIKKYPGFLLNSISFEIDEGEIFAYLGPNGSGKTTTVRLLLNLLTPESGEAKIMTPKNKIGFILEDEKPFESLYPLEYLMFFGEIYRLNNSKKRYFDILNRFGFSENKPIKNLSKGNQRKLCFVKSILHNPDIMLLDEPFEGIEPETRREIKDFLISYRKKGKSIFITSHNLYEMENLCTSFGIIFNGNFLGKWRIEEIKGRGISLEDFYINHSRGYEKT